METTTTAYVMQAQQNYNLQRLSGFTNESQPISLPFLYLLTLSVKLLSHYIIEYQQSRDLDPQHVYKLAYVSEKIIPKHFYM